MHAFLNRQNLIKFIKKYMPLIGFALLIYLFVTIGTDKIIATTLKISPLYVILAAFLTLPRLLIRNYQWQLILKKQKIHVSYLKSLKIFLIGCFYGSITPGYMGQLIKISYLKNETNEPMGKLFVNNVVFTAVNIIPLYCVMLIGAFLLIDKVPEIFLYASIVLLANIIIFTYFVKKERGEKTLYFLIKLFIPKKMKHHFTRFVNTFYIDFPKIKDLIGPVLLWVPFWIIAYTQIYILGLSLDIEISYFVFLFVYPIASVIALIPISSGGLGIREGAVVLLFSLFGVSPEKALVLSLAGYLIANLLTGFYGLIITISEADYQNVMLKLKQPQPQVIKQIRGQKKV